MQQPSDEDLLTPLYLLSTYLVSDQLTGQRNLVYSVLVNRIERFGIFSISFTLLDLSVHILLLKFGQSKGKEYICYHRQAILRIFVSVCTDCLKFLLIQALLKIIMILTSLHICSDLYAYAEHKVQELMRMLCIRVRN